MSKTLIKGGTVVTAIDQMEADVLVDGGKVVALLGRQHTVEDVEVFREGQIEGAGFCRRPGIVAHLAPHIPERHSTHGVL